MKFAQLTLVEVARAKCSARFSWSLGPVMAMPKIIPLNNAALITALKGKKRSPLVVS